MLKCAICKKQSAKTCFSGLQLVTAECRMVRFAFRLCLSGFKQEVIAGSQYTETKPNDATSVPSLLVFKGENTCTYRKSGVVKRHCENVIMSLVLLHAQQEHGNTS